jgi:TetR/AcrR family transcriptional repressor of nem operon
MPRTKEFDEAKVLDHALELFRARGFKATSFADLTSVLGVSRQSLYDTYGDKEELFLAALKRYMDGGAKCMKQQLADPGPVREVLTRIFDQLISQHCGKGSYGCLLVNTLVEVAADSPARALAAEHARIIEGLFISRLCVAQRVGEIDPEKDPVELARFFHHTLLGMAVAARAHDQTDALRQTARLALKVLD